jgi:mannose-6-phosphate isomerase-like protein (cupin superfamily)
MTAALQAAAAVIETPPGEGPPCNRHPFAQTFVIEAGTAAFYVDRRLIEATAGEMVVVPPDTRHAFRNVGDDTLRMRCIRG